MANRLPIFQGGPHWLTNTADAAAGDRPSPFALSHSLQEHSLLSLDCLADCALELQEIAGRFCTPEWPVEHHLGDLPSVLPGGQPPRVENCDVSTMIRTIGNNGCWVVLWNIEQIPRYAALLDSYLKYVQSVATPTDPEVFREGFVFISAPRSVTPIHIDPEHNALLQITGRKSVSVGVLKDQFLWNREKERVILGGDRHLPVEADIEHPFELTPGGGVYIPPFAPHWVRNGPATCISLSVTWRTVQAYRSEQVYRVNGRLRSLGLEPRPPGRSRLRDCAKIAVLRIGSGAVRAGRALLNEGRRYDPSAR